MSATVVIVTLERLVNAIQSVLSAAVVGLLVKVCVAVASTTGSLLNIRMFDELTPSGRLLSLP